MSNGEFIKSEAYDAERAEREAEMLEEGRTVERERILDDEERALADVQELGYQSIDEYKEAEADRWDELQEMNR